MDDISYPSHRNHVKSSVSEVNRRLKWVKRGKGGRRTKEGNRVGSTDLETLIADAHTIVKKKRIRVESQKANPCVGLYFPESIC